MARRRVWPQVLATTVVAALVLGGGLTALSTLAEDPVVRDVPSALRMWALWSAVSSPVAFVAGAVVFVVGRAVWRGRRGRPQR